MRKLVIILLLFLTLAVYANGIDDFYEWYFDTFSGIIDRNTGLTAFPLLEIAPGGRYEAMGTAFTAVSDDINFLYSNPSASAGLETTTLALVHHDWIADTNIEGILYSMRFGDLGIGFGSTFLYTPFTEYGYGNRLSTGYYMETAASANIAYNFIPSTYFYGISLGINLKAAYRVFPFVMDFSTNSASNPSAFTAMVDIGILTRFDLLKFYASRSKNFSIGIVVRNLGFPVLGDPLPSELVAGVAYQPVRPLLLSFDVTLPFSLVPEVPAESLSFAGGAEIHFTEFMAMQIGVNFEGSNTRFSLGTTINLGDYLVNINYLLDATTQVDRLDKFSVMISLNLGDEGRLALRQEVEELYLLGLDEYARGNYAKAIEYWEKALEIEPRNEPILENLKNAQDTLELQKKLEEAQSIE